MSPTEHPDPRLPVTAEIGSEGGSYAERGNQAATFSGPANPKTAARGPLAGTSVDRADDTVSGMVRYPTEPPSPPDAIESRRMGAHPWRNGLIGVAAGAAAWFGVSRLRRRAD